MVRVRRKRRVPAVALVAAGLLVAASCGDADDTAAPDGATTTAAGGATTSAATDTTAGGDDSTTTSGGTVEVAAFCDAFAQAESVFMTGPEMDEQGAPAAGAMERFAGQLQPLLDQLAGEAPGEVQDDVTEMVDVVGQALESGDMAATQTPEFLEAESRVEGYMYENCELDTQAELTAVDYEFQGLEEELSAGMVGFQMRNEGAEVHEFILFRFAEGEERSIQELLELPEEEAMSAAEFVNATVAEPGDTAYVLTELEPGRYAAVCFIPVGTTSLEDFNPEEGGAEQAPPHFTQGMHTEFTVG